MRKYLFIVGQALGHVGRALMVARELNKLGGIACIFTGASQTGSLEKTVKPEGFPAIPLRANNINVSPEVYTECLETVLHEEKPDLIVFDLSPLPWLSLLQLPDIPSVYITNYFLTGLGTSATVQDNIFHAYQTRINRTRETRGMKPLENARELYERDLVILADPAELCEASAEFPAHYEIAGGIWWEPDIPLPDELACTRDLLFISMGSTGLDVPDTLIQELKKILDISNAVKVPESDKAAASGTIPLWTGYTSLPGSQVLQHSKFCLTQGGAGSSYQALATGVPIGCWPGHLNHILLGKRLEELNVAVMLDPATWHEKLARLQDRWLIMTAAVEKFRHMNAIRSAQTAATRIARLQ